MHIQQEIPGCLAYGPKTLTYKARIHKLKSVFFTNWHCSLIISYQRHILVIFTWNHGSLCYWVECRKHQRKEENRQKKNTEKWRERKNEEHEEIQITTIYIFGFKLHFARKHKKLFIPSNFIYSFYAFQYIWNIVMIMYIIVRINIQIII